MLSQAHTPAYKLNTPAIGGVQSAQIRIASPADIVDHAKPVLKAARRSLDPAGVMAAPPEVAALHNHG